MKRATYRLRQFLSGFTARITPADHLLLDEILSGEQRQLFGRMPADAQRHSLNVLHELRNAGHNSADLAVAALLHDVGKVAASDAGAYLGLWLRGPMVLIEKFAPWLLPKFASSQPSKSWRYAIYVQLAHPQIGAKWAVDAGCTPLSCWLIEHHQYEQVDYAELQQLALLEALQWSDNQN